MNNGFANYAIILAGGSSERYGKDKLEETLLGKTVLQHSVDAFSEIAEVIVVGRRVLGTTYAEAGATRFRSLLNGLKSLPANAQGLVAVHDGDRPFITRDFVRRLFAEAQQKQESVIPRLKVTDTLYREKGEVIPMDRNEFFTVQTPQVHHIQRLFDAIRKIYAQKGALPDYPDESTLLCDAKESVYFTDGLRQNVKLTFNGDLPDFRTGIGFDVHPFAEGEGFVLGGVHISFDKKLQGHSDADVLCHALCDALLSASGNKDIGHQFPDTDPAYEGIDSTLLLKRCVELCRQSGFEAVNASATVICQQPRLAPYIDAMQIKLAQILDVPPSCVNISATTTERLGALGNGDGIACEAVTLIRTIRPNASRLG